MFNEICSALVPVVIMKLKRSPNFIFVKKYVIIFIEKERRKIMSTLLAGLIGYIVGIIVGIIIKS